MSYPILGETIFRNDFTKKIKYTRLMAHLFSIRFINPYTHKIIEVNAPLPIEFSQQL